MQGYQGPYVELQSHNRMFRLGDFITSASGVGRYRMMGTLSLSERCLTVPALVALHNLFVSIG